MIGPVIALLHGREGFVGVGTERDGMGGSGLSVLAAGMRDGSCLRLEVRFGTVIRGWGLAALVEDRFGVLAAGRSGRAKFGMLRSAGAGVGVCKF